VKRRLPQDDSIAFAFVSPSRYGLKIGVAASGITDSEGYKHAWAVVLGALKCTYSDVHVNVDAQLHALSILADEEAKEDAVLTSVRSSATFLGHRGQRCGAGLAGDRSANRTGTQRDVTKTRPRETTSVARGQHGVVGEDSSWPVASDLDPCLAAPYNAIHAPRSAPGWYTPPRRRSSGTCCKRSAWLTASRWSISCARPSRPRCCTANDTVACWACIMHISCAQP
jgi:hypothetical protein